MEILVKLLEAIPTVGFPIAIAIALSVFIYRIYIASEKREDKLMQEITATRDVNAQAIETLTKYAENLETIKNDIKEIKTDITKINIKVE